MKSSELRIGNYVNGLHGNSDIISTVKVVELKMSLKCNRIKAGCKNNFFDADEIKPIPLTKEWLLKFGFESREESTNFNYFGFGENPVTHDWMLCLKNFKDENRFFFLNGFHTIKYIHQLQNLYFALTNEELTLIK